MSITNDYLIRSITQLAEATLGLMGFRESDVQLEEIEIDVEQHLGMPLSMFEAMTLPGLMSFVTMARGPEPRRTMLIGLGLAAKCEQASDRDEDARVEELRPKALALLGAAFELEPPLRTQAIEQVYDALYEDQQDALG